MLRPLNDRILIRPDVAPTHTASGLHLVEHRKPDQVGTVVAVGRPDHPRRKEAETLARSLVRTYGENSLTTRASRLLDALVESAPSVKPGDTVVFSWQSGQEVLVDDDRFLLMREDDLLAVIEESA